MKKTLLLLIALSLLLACEKDSDDKPTNTDDLRIKKITFTDEDGEYYGVIFSYNNDKIASIDYYYSENGVVAMQVLNGSFTYNGNNVSQLLTEYSDGNIIDEHTVHYIFENDQIIEIDNNIYEFDRDYLETYHNRLTYQYTNGNLVSSKGYDETEHTGKEDYIYENDNLISSSYSSLGTDGLWHLLNKKEFAHSNNNISQYITYDYWSGIEDPHTKFEYSYAEDKLSEINTYSWDSSSNSWIYSGVAYSFSYNDKGYLAKIEEGDYEEITYEYEKGKGNIDVFIPPHFAIYQLPTYLGFMYFPL